MKRGVVGSWSPFVVLAVQNLVVFWQHYFRGYGFPWDFSQAYFGMNSFSVRALARGLLPQWMPFQCMGYPYPLDLQSGLYYPPLWIFAWLHVSYDLRSATVLQCFHVLFGALGMYLLLRRLSASRVQATVGAVMFQFFGGFYSNAEHVDIIRSFALLPWLFFAFTLAGDAPLASKVHRVLLPLGVFLLATGGYPGNLIASSFILGLYLVLQLVDALAKGRGPRWTAWTGLVLTALFALGLGLAATHLAPAWLERAEMARSSQHLQYQALRLKDLPLLFFSTRPQGGDPSMKSAFLTIPGSLLALFVSWKSLKERWIWIAVLATSLLMVAGPRSIVWRGLAALAPPFRLSRFPSSDYRPLAAVALVVLAAAGLRSLERGELGPWSFGLRGALALVAVAAAGRTLYGAWSAPSVVLALLVTVATLAVFTWIRARLGGLQAGMAIACLIALVALDAFRVLPEIASWHDPKIASLYQRNGWVDAGTEAREASMFSAFPARRPARHKPPHRHRYSWAGYVEGRFMLTDKAPCLLGSTSIVFDRPLYESYMSLPWTPLTLPPPPSLEGGGATGATVADHEFERALEHAESGRSVVRQTRYGIDSISYQVATPRPILLVENEMYFPGWEARAEFPGGARELRAISVDGVFRGWLLPAGTYRLVARFGFPHLALYRAVSLACLAAWLLLAVVGGSPARPSGRSSAPPAAPTASARR